MKYRKELTAKKVIEITRSYAKEIAAPKKKLPPLSPKAKKIAKIINDRVFGCYTVHACKLMDIILDEPISEYISVDIKTNTGIGNDMPMHVAIVMLANPNSHIYPLKKVCIHEYADFFIKKDGTTGNHAPLIDKKAWRLATNAEIIKAFK